MIQSSNFDSLNTYADKILRKDIYSINNSKRYCCCPFCKSNHFIKFGKYHGIQRYKCKYCDKTFSNSTNSLWKYLKYPPEKWIKFLELLIERRTLLYCAKALKISIVTAFNWRHKILHGLETIYIPDSFNDLVFMEMYYSRKSYKGNKHKHFEFSNNFNKRYNIAKRDVYTVISYDVNDNIIINNIGINDTYKCSMNKELTNNFKNNVYKYCDKKAYIHSNPIYDAPIFKYVVTHDKKVSKIVREKFEFDPNKRYSMDNIKCEPKVDNISIKLNKWIGRSFRGVSTRYLNHYCNLFSIIFVDKKIDCKKLFIDLFSSIFIYTSTASINSSHIQNY